ncbi:hypothetical protein BKA70DRAFT_674174 [Coprinopsis sp. MPI-PUGE-AT-0042]|nr:hypothetical protein BKA70DRAFT_674174 [Coprinopsis sp. MPI-PUGE-AT-0042]
MDAKKQMRDDYKKRRLDYLSLKAPIRRLPPEILGMVFSFTLGKTPFERWQYCTYGYLRRVCTTWRDVLATTPDVCRGLEVLLDRPPGQAAPSYRLGGVSSFEEMLAPWLAIVSRNHPYHLVLGATQYYISDPEGGFPDIARWILSTTPIPTILSIENSGIFSLLHDCIPRDNKISQLTLDFSDDVDRTELEEVSLEEIFPCLKSLIIDAPIAFSNPINHSNLQSLSLTDAYGSAQAFSESLMEMPRLRELRICSQQLYSRYRQTTHTLQIHSAVEILVVEGEDMMLLLEYLTFPSLKFLGLDAFGFFDDANAMNEVISAFLQRSCAGKYDFTASFTGRSSKYIIDLFIRNLPLRTRLHYALDVFDHDNDEDPDECYRGAEYSLIPQHAHCITEIFFSKTSDHLPLLCGDPQSLRDDKVIKLYLPFGVLQQEEVEIRQEELRGWGYALEIVRADAFAKLLRSSIPPMTIEWGI